VSPKRHRTNERGHGLHRNPLNLLAGLTRLELATSDVTGQSWTPPIPYLYN